ncbi:hypothetical protein LCGC14_0420810 [marine sediment metagenome]|uniref:Uncharacterized protein n=1 Tax=marine sediment metagenome TaxID=412755 RepID=A0A0F9T941_9ZZZZ
MARSLSATLLAAQKARIGKDLIRIVLTDNGNSYTYYSVSGANRIKELGHVEEDDLQWAEVILDNSDKTVSGINLSGFKAVISRGKKTSSGDEYSTHAPLYVISQELPSSPGVLEVPLGLAGIFNLMNEDEASESFDLEDDDSQTVKTLLRKIAGDTTLLDAFDHCKSYDIVFDSEDDLIDTFTPADSFSIPFQANRFRKWKELLNYTNCVARVEADGKIHIRVPTVTTTTQWAASTAYSVNDTVIPTSANEVEYICTTAGTSDSSEPTWPTEVGDTVADNDVVWTVGYDYDYRAPSLNHPSYHTFFSETSRRRVVIPGYIEVESLKSQDPSFTGNAEDPGFSGLSDEEKKLIVKRKHYRVRATSNAQCTNIATAILSHAQAAAERGWGEVPINVGAEVHDFVKIKDARLGDYRVGNISRIRWHYKEGSLPTMEFRFGKLGIGTAGTGTSVGEGHTHPHSHPHTHPDIHTFDIYDPVGNYVGTLGGLTEEVFLAALATASNLSLYNSSPTGGVSIAAGQLATTPADGTLLLAAAVAVKVDSGDSFIIPVL